MRIVPLFLATVLVSCSTPSEPVGAPSPAGPTGRCTVIGGIEFVEIEQPGKPSLWIARTEVTNAAFERVLSPRKRCAHSTADESPVVHATYGEAVEFCNRLTEIHSRTFRLPTEEEWEFACRAGTTTRYFFGDDVHQLIEYACVGEAARGPDIPSAGSFFNDGRGCSEDGGGWLWFEKETASVTIPVASRRPNPWGLFDMLGNAAEWCLDSGDRSVDLVETVMSSSIVSGRRDRCTPGEGRVVRGGSYALAPEDNPDAFACWSRRLRDAEWGAGFRVVLLPVPSGP